MEDNSGKRHFATELEESLRAIKGIASLLLRLGEVHGEDSLIHSSLGERLLEQQKRAQEVFERLHEAGKLRDD